MKTKGGGQSEGDFVILKILNEFLKQARITGCSKAAAKNF